MAESTVELVVKLADGSTLRVREEKPDRVVTMAIGDSSVDREYPTDEFLKNWLRAKLDARTFEVGDGRVYSSQAIVSVQVQGSRKAVTRPGVLR